jgi:hypothetical protein
MALCDNQSAPEYTHAPCTPDSDSNIFDGTTPAGADYIAYIASSGTQNATGIYGYHFDSKSGKFPKRPAESVKVSCPLSPVRCRVL